LYRRDRPWRLIVGEERRPADDASDADGVGHFGQLWTARIVRRALEKFWNRGMQYFLFLFLLSFCFNSVKNYTAEQGGKVIS